MKKPERGVGLLLEHVLTADSTKPRRPAFERLSAKLGHELAGMLVGALAAHASRRRDLVA